MHSWRISAYLNSATSRVLSLGTRCYSDLSWKLSTARQKPQALQTTRQQRQTIDKKQNKNSSATARTSAVRIFPCDCGAEGEGLETGEGDS
jgi:hypothetical protein